MLNDLLINFLCGRANDCRPADGFLTCPVEGEPVLRLAAPIEGLRGGGAIAIATGCAELGLVASTGDSVKLSNKLGVDEHDRPLVATLPKRKGGSDVSAVLGRCGTKLVEYALLRQSEGRVIDRLRLQEQVSQGHTIHQKRQAYSGN